MTERPTYYPDPTDYLPSHGDHAILVQEDRLADLIPRPWDTAIEVLGRYYARRCYGGRGAWIISPMVMRARSWDKWLLERAVEDFQRDYPYASVSVYDDLDEEIECEVEARDRGTASVMCVWDLGVAAPLTFVPECSKDRKHRPFQEEPEESS